MKQTAKKLIGGIALIVLGIFFLVAFIMGKSVFFEG